MAAVAFYVRPLLECSTAQQLAVLSSWATGAGHDIASRFVEPERKRGPDRRQEQRRMLAEGQAGTFAVVACTSLLSLARSCVNAAEVFAALSSAGVGVVVLSEGIDTGTDEGRTAAAFALAGRLEQACHAERATVGVRKRIADGFPHGRPRVPATTEARIVSLVRAGTSTERICRMVGCGKSTVYRVRDELKLA